MEILLKDQRKFIQIDVEYKKIKSGVSTRILERQLIIKVIPAKLKWELRGIKGFNYLW